MKFRNWECEIKRLQYDNGRVALRLIDAHTGEPIATATTNLPDEPLADNEVFIKTWNENEGMLAALEAAGIVKATGETVDSGYVQVPKAVLL